MFDGPDGYRVACDAWANAWRPKIPLAVSEWAARNRRLSPKSAAEPGPWRNDRTPYLVEIMDSLDVRKCPAPIVVFMKSSQVGATDAGLNWIGWTIEESPTSFQVFFPGEKLGRKWGRTRLEPMIALAPSLRARIPLGRRADKGDTVFEKHFDGGVLTMGSANIAIDMASASAERQMLDEVDRFPLEVEDEGDPVEIILRRAATYQGRRKTFLNSSPTIASLSHILKWWKLSSQAHYYVPCPHCQQKQVLVWTNIVYPDGQPEQARYRCAFCDELIAEHHKTDMLAGGEWRHDFPERRGAVVGFHLNCLYTPIGLGDTWAQNAEAYERSKRDPAKLKTFTNTRLGETHEDPTEKLDWEVLKGRREPFALGTVPRGALVLTAGVDVQKDRIEVQVIGWGRDERAWTVDYVQKPGDWTREELRQWLDDYLAKPFENTYGIPMRISACGVDAGFLQHDVVNWCRDRSRAARNIFAIKGEPKYGRQVIGIPTKVDVRFNGKLQARGAELYLVGVSTAKKALFERMVADGLLIEGVEIPVEQRHVHFSRDLPDEYFRQLASQVFDPHKRVWVNTYERDEALDTLVYAMAAAMHHSQHINRFGPADWARLAALYEPEDGAAPKAKAEPLGEKPIVTAKGAFIPMRARVKPSED